MAREVSTFLASLLDNLAADYPLVRWLQATPATTLAAPPGNLIGTIAVDDREEIDETAIDRMTGAWYVKLPLVVSLYFNRANFADYELPRDFAFSIAAWFRKRQVGTPSQGASQVGTLVREVEIGQKIDDGVDTQILHNWLLWQVRLCVPQAIDPSFPAIPGIFETLQGPPPEEEVYFERIYVSRNPEETDPNQAEQIAP